MSVDDTVEISGYAERLQIILTHSGMLQHSAEQELRTVDANQTLIVLPGHAYTNTYSSIGAGFGCLVITPAQAIRPQIYARITSQTNAHLMSDAARIGAFRLLRLTPDAEHGIKAALAQEVLRAVFHSPGPNLPAPSRVVEFARRAMHEQAGQRCSLAEVAERVGVTPSYLTQEFKRSMGMPLYQYQLRLRMTRALLELPRCQDITELALALGFSSHSHFTAAFKSFFGATPSAYRSESRPTAHCAAPGIS